MALRSQKAQERIAQMKKELSLRNIAAQWAGWIVKIVLTIMSPEKSNYFPEGVPGTSFNECKKPANRQRVVLMAKLDMSSETPSKISPLSGMLCYQTVVDPSKIEYHTTPGTDMPCFNLVTEIHSGVNRGDDMEGFVGITVETWKFAILDHMIGVWNVMRSKGLEHKLKIRDADGVLLQFSGESGIRKLYRVPSDEVLARDLQRYEDAILRDEKDARYRYPRQARTKLTPGYSTYVNLTHDIPSAQIPIEDGGFIRGLFYLEDTDYLQYSCDNGISIQMYPEGPPNYELGELAFGHRKYTDVSSEEKNKILRSRVLFSNRNNAIMNPAMLEHFTTFSDFQQSIVRMCACVYGGYCCYMNPKYNRAESDDTHKQHCALNELCCRLRYCVSKPDTFTELIDLWIVAGNQAVENDRAIIRAKKAFRQRTPAELANKCGTEAVKMILERESDSIDDLDVVVSLTEKIPKSDDSDPEMMSYLTLTQIVDKLSKFIERNAVLNILSRSLVGSEQKSEKEKVEMFRDLLLDILSTRTLQYEFEKFRFKHRNSTINGKPIEPEFWAEWRIWLGAGLQSRDYIFRVKQKYYQTLALEESQRRYDALMKSWNSPNKPTKKKFRKNKKTP